MTASSASPTTAGDVMDRLGSVMDPEVGISIVELGLVYDVRVDGTVVEVVMSMTTPACPLGDYFEQAVTAALADVTGPGDVRLDITFDPPWTPEFITPTGRELLGWSR